MSMFRYLSTACLCLLYACSDSVGESEPHWVVSPTPQPSSSVTPAPTPSVTPDPNQQVLADINISSPPADSNFVATAKIGPPVALRFLSAIEANYEFEVGDSNLGASQSIVIGAPPELKSQGVDYVNNIVWQTSQAAPGIYTLTLSWTHASAPGDTFGDAHPVYIQLTLTN